MIQVFGITGKVFTTNRDAMILPLKAKIHKKDNGDCYIDSLSNLLDKHHIM